MKTFGKVLAVVFVAVCAIYFVAQAQSATVTNRRQGGTTTLGGGIDRSVVTIVRTINFAVDDVVNGDSIQVFNVPLGTVVLGVQAKCVTANGAAATVDIGDADDATQYFSNFNMNSAAQSWSDDGVTTTPFVNAKRYSAAGIISVKSDSTIGTGSLEVKLVAIKP